MQMKKINKSIQTAGAVAVMILAGGCAKTLTAEYVMPPKTVADVKAIDTMQLVTNVKVSDNSPRSGDHTYIIGALNQRVAARFCQEGFFRTTDFVWGNPDGAAKIAGVLLNDGNLHGYARHTTDSVSKRARLYLTLDVRLNSSHVRKNLAFVLKDIPYRVTWVGNQHKVPVGTPDMAGASIQNVIFPVDVMSISARGRLAVKLVNKNGETVYTRNFDNLNYSFEINETRHASLPSKSAAIMEMLVPAIETIVMDLSPHKESRNLVINRSGDEKACLLLQAQAFTEAIATLDELEEKSYADFENLGLAYEVIGDYPAAKGCFADAIKSNPDAKIAKEGLQRMENILAAKADLRKMDAEKTDTQYKKSEFK